VRDGERSAGRTARRAVGAAVAAAMLVLALASTASADTATLSVLTTTGASDPVADVPRIFQVDGTTSLDKWVYVKYRPAGGAPCAPTASSDSGYYLFSGRHVNGTFKLQEVYTWSNPGDYLFCIWLSSDDSDTITTPIAQTISFRGPNGTISATVDPASPGPQQRTVVTIAGSTETPAAAFAKIRTAGGAGCAPTASSDSGSYLLAGTAVNGAFAFAVETRQAAGTYLVCLWLAEDSDDASPIAGPQTVTFTVHAPPPPPCVVPRLGSDRRGATVKAQIRAAHCKPGARRRIYSRRPKGHVIRLSPRAGTQLPYQSLVGLTISKGRRPHHRHR